MLKYLLLLFCLCPTVVFSKIETKTVEVNGIASDESSAINNALVEAISQINGAKIAAEVKTSLSQVSTKEGADVKKTFDKNVSKITNGLVKSYQVLSSEKDENLFKVRLSVQVSKFKKSVQTKRLRLAVVPFRAANTVKITDATRKFEGAITAQLENYLSQSRRFALVDRSVVKE